MIDYTDILKGLREQREVLAEAIAALERIARGQGRRRGRPPAWMAQSKHVAEVVTRKRKPFSLATRRKMAAAQRRRYAAIREAKG
jgi:hypothetical protein